MGVRMMMLGAGGGAGCGRCSSASSAPPQQRRAGGGLQSVASQLLWDSQQPASLVGNEAKKHLY